MSQKPKVILQQTQSKMGKAILEHWPSRVRDLYIMGAELGTMENALHLISVGGHNHSNNGPTVKTPSVKDMVQACHDSDIALSSPVTGESPAAYVTRTLVKSWVDEKLMPDVDTRQSGQKDGWQLERISDFLQSGLDFSEKEFPGHKSFEHYARFVMEAERNKIVPNHDQDDPEYTKRYTAFRNGDQTLYDVSESGDPKTVEQIQREKARKLDDMLTHRFPSPLSQAMRSGDVDLLKSRFEEGQTFFPNEDPFPAFKSGVFGNSAHTSDQGIKTMMNIFQDHGFDVTRKENGEISEGFVSYVKEAYEDTQRSFVTSLSNITTHKVAFKEEKRSLSSVSESIEDMRRSYTEIRDLKSFAENGIDFSKDSVGGKTLARCQKITNNIIRHGSRNEKKRLFNASSSSSSYDPPPSFTNEEEKLLTAVMSQAVRSVQTASIARRRTESLKPDQTQAIQPRRRPPEDRVL